MYVDQKIFDLGFEFGWVKEQAQPAIGLLIFVKPGMQINLYTTTMTVGTSLNHPKHGKTQMFRRNCSLQDLRAIFKNPRAHLNKGYRMKRA